MEKKILSDEERKKVDFVFAVLDGTIAEYGRALLDCGHETNGRRVGAIKDEKDRYFLYCFECFDKYSENNNLNMEVESVSKPIIIKAPTIH